MDTTGMRKFLSILCLFAVIIIPSLAFADCDDIGDDPDFQKGFKALVKLYEAGEYQKTIDAAKPLFAKCKESPAVLYYTGLAFRDQGNIENAKVYIQKASEALSFYTTDVGISRKIWFDRYELEHPDATAEAVQSRKVMIEALTNQANQYQTQIEDIKAKNNDYEVIMAASGNALARYKSILWTGAGIAISGVVITAIGGGIIGKVEPSDENNINYVGKNIHLNSTYKAGQILTGIGIGLTISGAVTAGIGGYFYTHLESKKSSNVDVSFNIAPTNASVKLVF